MKKIRSCVLSCLVAFVLVLGVLPTAALAQELPAADEVGTVSVTMNSDGQKRSSICDPLFAEKADVAVTGDMATIKLYVAFPVPGFPDLGKDGTLKNFVITYQGKDYLADSDITSKPVRKAKATNPMFGVVEGKDMTTQVLTVQLPKDALQETFLDVKAYVNVVMNTDVNFDMYLKDLALEPVEPVIPEPEQPTSKLEDGKYKVQAALWHESKDQASLGDSGFVDSRQIVATVEGGKVTTVEANTNPAKMGTIISAITKIVANGEEVEVLKTDKITTVPAGNTYDYISAFRFRLPEEAQPAELAGVTYVPMKFLVPDTPMGNGFMSARFRIDWSTAVKMGEDEKPVLPETPEVPETKPLEMVDKATGIRITGESGVFTEEVHLIVTPIASEEESYQSAAKALQDVGKKFKLYAIRFENEQGEEVQPNGVITVAYPAPEGYDAAKLVVYRVNEDGTKTKVNGALEEGLFTVQQKNMGTYALVEEGSTMTDQQNTEGLKTPAPNTGDLFQGAGVVITMAVCAALAGGLLAAKKRRDAR